MGAKGIEVGDGVGDDDAVATVAGFRDHPAFIEEGPVGEVLGKEIGEQGAVFSAVAVGEEEHAVVPELRVGDGKRRAADRAGFQRDRRRGRGRSRRWSRVKRDEREGKE